MARTFQLHYQGAREPTLGTLTVAVSLEGVYRHLLREGIVILATQLAQTFLIGTLVPSMFDIWVTRSDRACTVLL